MFQKPKHQIFQKISSAVRGLLERTGATTVPQILIGQNLIDGNDALQGLYVLLVKVYMVDPKSKYLLNILNTVAANLDIPLTVIPFLQRVWGRRLL